MQTRTHNPSNEIVTIDNSTTSIHHDPSGNMTRIPNPRFGETSVSAASFFYATRRFTTSASAQPATLNLTYDAWNRLVRVAKPDGTAIATYTYDGLNRRIFKTTSTETRRFYYNRNWQCLLETATNKPAIHYTWGLRYVDDLVCRHVGLDRIYALTDPNWNVVALTDSAATPVERYTYNTFGRLNIYDGNFTPRSSSNYNWTRTFTGQVFDVETGLMLYRNRFYSNTLGRFLTRDPIGYRGRDENQYRYVTNNPIIFLDRNGLIRFKEDGVIIEIHKTDADEQIGQHGHFEQGKGSIKDGYKIRVEDGAIFDSHNQPIFNGINQLKLKKKTYEKFLDWLKKQQKAGKLGCIVTVTISIPEVAQAAETDGLTGVAEQITNIGLEAAKDTAIAGAAGAAIVSTTIASGGTLTTVTGGTVIATGTTTVSGGTIVAGGTVAGIGTVATVGGLAIAAGGAGYAVGSAIATTKPGRVVTEGLGNAILGVCSWCFQW